MVAARMPSMKSLCSFMGLILFFCGLSDSFQLNSPLKRVVRSKDTFSGNTFGAKHIEQIGSQFSVLKSSKLGPGIGHKAFPGCFPKVPSVVGESVVLWYGWSDLRVHDHEALIKASSGRDVTPVFIFDPKALASVSAHTAACIHAAVQGLEQELRERGSGLVVRVGKTEDVLPEIVREVSASTVLYHNDVSSPMGDTIQKVLGVVGEDVRFVPWQSHLNSDIWNKLESAPTIYTDFEKLVEKDGLFADVKCYDAPEAIPPLSESVQATALPSFEEDIFPEIQKHYPVDLGKNSIWDQESLFGLPSPFAVKELSMLNMLDDYVQNGDVEFASKYLVDNAEEESSITGLERANIQRIIEQRGLEGLAPGEAFSRVLSQGIALGCLSPSRLFLSRDSSGKGGDIFSTCWAKETAIRNEWHSLIASKDISEPSTLSGVADVKYWKWNGWLCRYAVGGNADSQAPPLLLVHGFGASVEQWKGVFEQLSQEYQVYALDLIGFGHSQKPPLCFSQYTWQDQVRDFATQIIQKPFVVAGNSIGGFTAMSVAADSSQNCKGLVLINSAGKILTPEQYEEELEMQGGRTIEEKTRVGDLGPYRAPPNFVLQAFGFLIFSFLQGRIEKTCMNLYPTNPDPVKNGLAESILRDSCDPGAIGVIAAGGKLPTPRPANELLQKFGGPVLVTQGILDPLNDAKGRLDLLKKCYPNVEACSIQAGHCPHHEVPKEVSQAIKAFVEGNIVRVNSAVEV